MIQQLSVFLENKSGRLAEMTRVLGDASVNMHALMVADTTEFGVIRIICDNPVRAKAVLEEAGFGVSVTLVTAVEIPDRPGGLADVLEALDAAGVNVEYAYCFVEPSGDAAVDVFKVDTEGAETALRNAGFKVMSDDELYAPDGS
ncbi:MAG TPA: ACT domain-containing protein [Coriobacteriia bacterium]|nr:ACT domain-containing protein [Coriobacteriia bacterium]